MRTRLLTGCLLALVLTTATACTGSDDGKGVASAGGTAAPSVTPSLSLLEQGIRWARCMRAHGVPQPDPVAANGDGIRFQGYSKDGVDPDAVRQAQEACKSLSPVLPEADRARKQDLSRLLARCMRAQGVENFPDPQPDGHFEISPQVEQDPQFPSAKETCDAQEDAAAASGRPSR
jgi:hypothetical protein